MESEELMQSMIARVLSKNGADQNSDKFIPTAELWDFLKKEVNYDSFDTPVKEKMHRRFLTALHSSRSSLAFFESTMDPETKVISWRLRTQIQDVSLLFSFNDGKRYSPTENSQKHIDELQKEVMRLRSEIRQLEVENAQWQQAIDRTKQVSPPQVLQNFAVYEKHLSVIESISQSFTDIENNIIEIGDKLIKPLQ